MEEITFGLELEFVTPILKTGDPDPDESSERNAYGDAGKPRFVARVDNDNGPYSEPGYFKVYKHLAGLINTVAPEKANMSIEARPDHSYDTWFVKEESTANEECRVGPGLYLDWNNVEITTPVYATPTSGDIQWPSSIGDVTRLIRQSCRVRTNNTCALHIHVGLRSLESQGHQEPELHLCQKLVTLKKLATLLWLAEDRIMTLCHPLRRKPDGGWNASLRRSVSLEDIVYNAPLFISKNNEEYAAWLGPAFESAGAASQHSHVIAKMSAIWTAKTWYQMASLLKHPEIRGKLVFDFSQLSRIGTVEFRPMEASFDEALMKHWTAICTRIVMYANLDASNDNIQRYQSTIVNLLKDESNYSVWDFLEDIGCSAQASWFKDKCARDDREMQKLHAAFGDSPRIPIPYYLPADGVSFFPPQPAEPWDVHQ